MPTGGKASVSRETARTTVLATSNNYVSCRRLAWSRRRRDWLPLRYFTVLTGRNCHRDVCQAVKLSLLFERC